MVGVNNEGDQCSVLYVNVCDKEKIVVVVMQRTQGEPSAVSSSISATPGLLVLRSKRARIRDTAAQYPELEQGMLRIRR